MKAAVKKITPDLLAVGAILLVLVIFFYKFLFLGMVPLNADWLSANFDPWKSAGSQIAKPYFNNDTDPVLYMYPIKYITIKTMKEGRLPLWNPHILCGVPLWGNNFSTPLNPLNIVFFLFDFIKAWGLFFMLQFAAAGIGMYMFCVGRGMEKIAASISALSYMLNTSFVLWFPTMSYLGVLAWLPLVFLMIDRVFEHKNMLTAFWCGISFALFFWSGLIQLAVYSSVFAGAYLVFRYLQTASWDRGTLKKYTGLIAVVLLAALIYSLPELMIQKVNIFSSTRTPNRYGMSFLYPQMLMSYISPHFYGIKYDGWDLGYGTYIFNRGFIRLSPPYIGILPLFLAVIGFFTRKGKDVFFYLVFSAGILGVLITLPVTHKLLVKIMPFFDSVDHYRLTALYVFSMSVMAGWGLSAVLSNKTGKRLIAKITLAVFLSILAIFIFTQLLSYVNVGGLKAFLGSFEKKAPGFIFDGSHSLKSVYKFVEYLKILNRGSGALLLSPEVFVPMAFSLIAALLIICLLNFRKSALWWSLAAFSFVAFDLLYYGLDFPAYSHASNVYPASPSANFLAQDKALYRVVGYSGQKNSPYGDVYPPNTGMVYGLYDIRGYENIAQPRWLYRFMMGGDSRDIVIARISDYNGKFIPFLNVKYLISDEPVEQSGWKLAYDKEVKIYENMKVAPRAFFAKKVLVAEDGDSSYSMIKKKSFDPFGEAVVEAGEKDVPYRDRPEYGSDPRITYYNPNEVIIKSDGKAAGLLVLADTYFPGWKALVDGKERRLMRANHAFRAVFVKKGEKIIRFVFRPAGLYEILYTCLILFAAAVVVSLVRLVRRVSRSVINEP